MSIRKEDWTAPKDHPSEGKTFKVVTFELQDDPVEYHLFKDFDQICTVEEETGVNLMRAMAGGQITATQTRALLFALLKTSHAVLLEEAGELLSRPDWTTVLNALSLALGIEEAAPEAAKEVPEAAMKEPEPVDA